MNNLNKKAVALVGVLWIVVLLTAIITTVARSSRLDIRIVAHNAEKIKAKWATRAGLEFVIAVLDEDERDSDSLIDRWSDHEGDFNDVEIGNCIIDINVTDVASKLNINTIESEQLAELDYMTETILDSIMDWRDEDDDVRENGAEKGYYSELAPAYNIRNGYFRTINELLAVREIEDAHLFSQDCRWSQLLTCYSRDKNKSSDQSSRVNINTASERDLKENLKLKDSHAKWIVENKPDDGYESITDLISNSSPKTDSNKRGNNPQALDIQTYKDIVDKITVTDDQWIWGRINVNTADQEALRIFFEDDSDLAYSIAGNRGEDYIPMDSIADLLDVEGMTIDKFKKFGDKITTRSDVYNVVVTSKSAGLGLNFRTQAIIDRSSDDAKIIYMYNGIEN